MRRSGSKTSRCSLTATNSSKHTRAPLKRCSDAQSDYDFDLWPPIEEFLNEILAFERNDVDRFCCASRPSSGRPISGRPTSARSLSRLDGVASILPSAADTDLESASGAGVRTCDQLSRSSVRVARFVIPDERACTADVFEKRYRRVYSCVVNNHGDRLGIDLFRHLITLVVILVIIYIRYNFSSLYKKINDASSGFTLGLYFVSL